MFDNTKKELMDKIKSLEIELNLKDTRINDHYKDMENKNDQIRNLKKEFESLETNYRNLKNEYSSYMDRNVCKVNDYINNDNENKKLIEDLRSQLEEQKKINEKYLQDYRDILAKNKVYLDTYLDLKQTMDEQISLSNKLTNANMEKDNIIASQGSVMNAVLSKNYDKKHIEFAAVKTYRGWEYIYHNGKNIDVNNVNSIRVSWDVNENVTLEIDQ